MPRWKAYQMFMALYYLFVHIYIVLYARAPVAATIVESDIESLRIVAYTIALTFANVMFQMPALSAIIKKPESPGKDVSSKRAIVKMLAFTFAFWATCVATAVYSMHADGHSPNISIYVLYPFYACWAIVYPAYGYVLWSKTPKPSDKSA